MKKIAGKTAYYSHSKSTYNTEKEKTILRLLTNYFDGQIICPNRDIGHLKNSLDYLNISETADCIFVSPSETHEEYISIGCYKEVENASAKGIPVFAVDLENDALNFRLVCWAEIEKRNESPQGIRS